MEDEKVKFKSDDIKNVKNSLDVLTAHLFFDTNALDNEDVKKQLKTIHSTLNYKSY